MAITILGFSGNHGASMPKFQPKRAELEANRRCKSKWTRGGTKISKPWCPSPGAAAPDCCYLGPRLIFPHAKCKAARIGEFCFGPIWPVGLQAPSRARQFGGLAASYSADRQGACYAPQSRCRPCHAARPGRTAGHSRHSRRATAAAEPPEPGNASVVVGGSSG